MSQLLQSDVKQVRNAKGFAQPTDNSLDVDFRSTRGNSVGIRLLTK